MAAANAPSMMVTRASVWRTWVLEALAGVALTGRQREHRDHGERQPGDPEGRVARMGAGGEAHRGLDRDVDSEQHERDGNDPQGPRLSRRPETPVAGRLSRTPIQSPVPNGDRKQGCHCAFRAGPTESQKPALRFRQALPIRWRPDAGQPEAHVRSNEQPTNRYVARRL